MKNIVDIEYEIEVKDLFERIDKNIFFDEFELKREFVGLKSEIEKYKILIDRIEKTFRIIDDGRQRYSREFFFDNKKKNLYRVWWEINKAKEVIKENNINVCQFCVNELIGQVDRKVFEESKPDIVSTEPIIIAFYDPCNMDIIIDGNHRISAAYKRNEKSINAYFMEPQYHMQAMLEKSFVDMYKIHHNLVVILNYMVGNIDKVIYRNDGMQNSLYKIENKNNNIIKKVINFVCTNRK